MENNEAGEKVDRIDERYSEFQRRIEKLEGQVQELRDALAMK